MSRRILYYCQSLVREVSIPRAIEKEQGMVASVVKHIHTVFVRGDPDVIRFDETFSLASEIAGRLVHTGYIAPPLRAATPSWPRRNQVLVTQGGGNVGRELLEAAIGVAALMPGMQFVLAAGARAARHEIDALRARVTSANVDIRPFLSDFPEQLRASALSINMGGDNTLLDVLAARTPSLAYPYQANPEQGIRIAAFAKKGLVHALSIDDLRPERLKARIEHALAAPPLRHDVAMDGARVTSARILSIIAPNPIAAENARAGSQDWQLDRPGLASEIEGYASATSVDRGQTIALYVNTRASCFTVEVFRMGWYAGVGARRVFGPRRVTGAVQPEPSRDPDTGLVDCAWTHPFVLSTADPSGNAWPSGVYLARLSAGALGDGMQSWIIFVVRDDARRADLLVQLPVTTWQAYNTWGSKSLYRWGSAGRVRAAKVSFNRPYAANPQNPAAGYGVGAGEFLTNLQPHPDTYGTSNAGWDINLVRWLEREGRDVAYCTSLDTHAQAPTRERCKAWLSSGHDEYWSWSMREHVEQARDAGVHLAFFGANAAYWQIRLEPSAASGTADRVMVCHKKAARDPCVGTRFVTDRWRSEAVNRPEEALVGVMVDADPVDGDIVIAAPAHWLFDGTGLERGSVLPGLLGYEVDRMQGHGPAHLEVLAASPWKISGDKAREGVAHMTLATAPSGALVFATGSMQWAWGLDDFNAPGLRPARSSAAAERVMRNLLARFAG